jgi:anti-sigma B factor antagonist
LRADEDKHELSDGALTIVRRAEDGEETVALAGEVDLANAHTLTSQLESLPSDGATRVTLDLTDLEFIDSTGIAALVAACRRLGDGEIDLRIVRSRASAVRRVMEITGLDDRLPFVDPAE